MVKQNRVLRVFAIAMNKVADTYSRQHWLGVRARRSGSYLLIRSVCNVVRTEGDSQHTPKSTNSRLEMSLFEQKKSAAKESSRDMPICDKAVV